MFVCPNTRLTLSIGIPFESAKVANECRPISKRLDIFSYPNLSHIQTFLGLYSKSVI